MGVLGVDDCVVRVLSMIACVGFIRWREVGGQPDLIQLDALSGGTAIEDGVEGGVIIHLELPVELEATLAGEDLLP
jgi:hypothetical protein